MTASPTVSGMRPDMRPAPVATSGIAQISIASDPMEVRLGLARLFETPLLTEISDEAQGSAEIVLVEVLNNIVEHAYAKYPGKIQVTVQRMGPDLCVHVCDTGLPLPGGEMPVGVLPTLDPDGDLPEGGFGWHLIRLFAKDVSYIRTARQNHLRFHLPV